MRFLCVIKYINHIVRNYITGNQVKMPSHEMLVSVTKNNYYQPNNIRKMLCGKYVGHQIKFRPLIKCRSSCQSKSQLLKNSISNYSFWY